MAPADIRRTGEGRAMPIHDWTRVDADIFHDFHSTWVVEIKRALNRGLLPPEYYALAEQIAGGFGPDVLTLQRPAPTPSPPFGQPSGGIQLAAAPPKVRFHFESEAGQYAGKAKAVVIRHRSNHQVIAMVEIVSAGNKSSMNALRQFVRKAQETLLAGVHLLIADLFPPGPRDPHGLHPPIWERESENGFALPADKPLTLASYVGGPRWEAFVEPVAVGDVLPDMPLFLTPEVYIPVPLEATYQAAWQAVPAFWRDVLSGGSPPA
jgi:hypothetical protein